MVWFLVFSSLLFWPHFAENTPDCCSRCVDGCTMVSHPDFCRQILCSLECAPCNPPFVRLEDDCSSCIMPPAPARTT